MKNFFCTIFLFFISLMFLSAQSKNITSKDFVPRRALSPLGFGINIFAPSVIFTETPIAFYADYYLNPQWIIEIGSDLVSVYSGIRFLPMVRRKDHFFSPYIGTTLIYNRNKESKINIYIPFGAEVFFKNGIVASAEFAPVTVKGFNEFIFYGFKLGYQFKIKK